MSLNILSVTADLVDFLKSTNCPWSLEADHMCYKLFKFGEFHQFVFLKSLCQQDESVSIHSCCVQGYQDIYRSVEPMMKTLWSTASLQPWAGAEDQASPVGDAPSLLETEQPDGCITNHWELHKQQKMLSTSPHERQWRASAWATLSHHSVTCITHLHILYIVSIVVE